MIIIFSFYAYLTRSKEALLRLEDNLSRLSIVARILHLHAHNFSTQKTQGILLNLSLAVPEFKIVIVFHKKLVVTGSSIKLKVKYGVSK
jgi:hypothetical protein